MNVESVSTERLNSKVYSQLDTDLICFKCSDTISLKLRDSELLGAHEYPFVCLCKKCIAKIFIDQSSESKRLMSILRNMVNKVYDNE